MGTFKKFGLALSLAVPCSVFAAAGDLDVTFSGDGIAQPPAQTSAAKGAVQADGKIVVVGTGINAVNGLDNHMVARYLPNGDLDTSFGNNGFVITNVPVGGAWDNWAMAVAIQLDGKIVVAGGVYLRAAGEDFTVARYNPNGSLDTSFGVSGAQRIDFGNFESDVIADMKLQADGKIVLVGTSAGGQGSDA